MILQRTKIIKYIVKNKDKTMANVKKFEDFVKENTENKGKGVGGDTDLIPRPTPKQTINKGDLNPVDQLGIAGRQITTDKIDGIVKSVKDDTVYVEDRLTKQIKEFTVKEFLSEFHKSYKKEKKEELKKSNESIIIEPEPELTTEDKELLDKILNVNESEKKELWEKTWESFATNYVKKMKDVDEDFEEFFENPLNETIGLQELSENAIEPKEIFDEKEEISLEENKSEIKVQKFQSFINDRIKIKPDTIDEDMNLDEDDDEETIGIAENSVQKQTPQVKCADCGQEVDDEEFDKVRHLYSKHNYKATVDDLTKWLLEYFPPEVPEDEEKKKK